VSSDADPVTLLLLLLLLLLTPLLYVLDKPAD
jgi:hypothetical protein